MQLGRNQPVVVPDIAPGTEAGTVALAIIRQRAFGLHGWFGQVGVESHETAGFSPARVHELVDDTDSRVVTVDAGPSGLEIFLTEVLAGFKVHEIRVRHFDAFHGSRQRVIGRVLVFCKHGLEEETVSPDG